MPATKPLHEIAPRELLVQDYRSWHTGKQRIRYAYYGERPSDVFGAVIAYVSRWYGIEALDSIEVVQYPESPFKDRRAGEATVFVRVDAVEDVDVRRHALFAEFETEVLAAWETVG